MGKHHFRSAVNIQFWSIFPVNQILGEEPEHKSDVNLRGDWIAKILKLNCFQPVKVWPNQLKGPISALLEGERGRCYSQGSWGVPFTSDLELRSVEFFPLLSLLLHCLQTPARYGIRNLSCQGSFDLWTCLWTVSNDANSEILSQSIMKSIVSCAKQEAS